jgi:hypothetical protein
MVKKMIGGRLRRAPKRFASGASILAEQNLGLLDEMRCLTELTTTSPAGLEVNDK